MTIRCKCHGVSGNCNVKTCKKGLPSFGKVGIKLKDRYDTAAKVHPIQIIGKRRITRNHLRHSENVKYRPTTKDFVYLEESPNFCIPNISEGSLGTHGRYCNGSHGADGNDSCRNLCCGRGWNTENLTRMENCKCTFKWCCVVECQKCEVTREFSYCK